MRTFEAYLNEIGDSRKPYPFSLKQSIQTYKRMDQEFTIYTGRAVFITDAKRRFYVSAAIQMDTFGRENIWECEVTFGVAGTRWAFNATDDGLAEAFRVMSTTIAAVKKFVLSVWKKHGVATNEIVFNSSNEDKHGLESAKKGKQRVNLYKAFIKKEIPGAKFDENPMGGMHVTIPKKFFK